MADMGKKNWAMGLALAWAMSGCSKSEVRSELSVVTKPEPASRAKPAEASSLEEETRTCREIGGVACERLLARQAEVAAKSSGLQKQAWFEALAAGCLVSPTDELIEKVTSLLTRSTSEAIDARPVLTMSLEACERGVAVGCVLAANAYSRPGELEPNPPEAARLFEKACSAGMARACARAATIHLEYVLDLDAVEEGRQRAITLVRGPCEAGDGEACTVWAEAVIYRNLAEEQRDYAEARRLVKRACESGWARACNHHADLSLLGLGGDKDVENGVVTLKRNCERAESDEATAYACAALAFLHAGRSSLVAVDREAARRFAARACEVQSQLMAAPCTVVGEVEGLLEAAGR